MIVETIQPDEAYGFTVELHIDEDAESPRQWDNVTKMYCLHNRYCLGDEHNGRTPDDVARMINDDKAVAVLPLYLYDHGGITMRTTPFHCPWDSGQVGFAIITRDAALSEFGWKVITKKRLAKLEEIIRQEVATYDQFLTGEVYGYVIKDGDDEVDSLWGMYGTVDTVREEALQAACHEKERNDEKKPDGASAEQQAV